MNKLLNVVIALVVAIAAVSANAAREVKTKDFSGWLEDYDSLVYSEERNAFVFFNEDKRGKYSKLMIQSVEIYSRNAKSNREIAVKSADYLKAGAEKLLRDRGILATEAGPGVLRYHMAITGVEKSKEDLKAHNVIPVSALFRGAQAATGNVKTYIDAMFEAEMVDSVTGERAAAIVRKGIAETEKRSGDELAFEDVIPTLDAWLVAFGETLDAFIARKK